MKNIKKFETYINEELDAETYLSAADKLKQKGHRNRAEKLRKYAHNMTKKTEPIVVELYGKKFNLTDKNIIVFKDGKDDDEVSLYVAFDRDYHDNISKDDFEAIWNDLSSKDKEDFHKEHKSLMDDEVWEEKVMKGEVLNNDWSEMSDDEKEFFEEWADMNQFLLGVSTTEDGEFDVDGVVIKDRKTALKIMKLIKNFANLYGGKLKDAFSKLTVNDLYYD
jgi:hypothetical protein